MLLLLLAVLCCGDCRTIRIAFRLFCLFYFCSQSWTSCFLFCQAERVEGFLRLFLPWVFPHLPTASRLPIPHPLPTPRPRPHPSPLRLPLLTPQTNDLCVPPFPIIPQLTTLMCVGVLATKRDSGTNNTVASVSHVTHFSSLSAAVLIGQHCSAAALLSTKAR